MTNLTGNTQPCNRVPNRTIAKLLALVLISVGLSLFIGVQQASANITLSPTVPGPPDSRAIPDTIRTYLETCDRGTRSPAFGNWISPVGTPQQTSTSVRYGTTNVILDLHINGAVCLRTRDRYRDAQGRTQKLYPTQTRSKIIDVQATPPPGAPPGLGREGGLIDAVRILPNFDDNPGTYVDTAANTFTYSPNGGFTVSGTYFVTVTIKSINLFSDSDMVCVGGDRDPGTPNTRNWEFDICHTADVTIPINIDVIPPANQVQGRVYNLNTGQGIPNVDVSLCYGAPEKTNGNGDFSKTITSGSSYCANVDSPVAGLLGPFIRPWGEGYPGQLPSCPGFTSDQNPNYCSQSAYTNQIAGGSSSLSNTDRLSDTGFDFVYYADVPPPPPPPPPPPGPPQPSLSINCDSSGGTSTATISWDPSDTSYYYVDLDFDSESFAGSYYNKGAPGGATSTTGPGGFNLVRNGPTDLSDPMSPLQSGTAYVARIFYYDGSFAQTHSPISQAVTAPTCGPAGTNPPAPNLSISCDASGSTSTATISWVDGGGNSVYVDLDKASGGFNGGFYNKGVNGPTSTTGPGGFNGYNGASGGMPALASGTQYIARLYYNNGSFGNKQSPISQAVTAPPCGPTGTNPPQPSLSINCDPSGNTSTATISWVDGGGSYFVDLDQASGGFSGGFYNKGVGSATSTTGPGGFNGYNGASGGMPPLANGTAYIARIFYVGGSFDGRHSPISQAVTAPPCRPVIVNPSAPSLTITCNPATYVNTASITWGSGNGGSSYFVDLDTAAGNFGGSFYNKGVNGTTSTTGPGGFNSYPPGGSGMPPLVANRSYVARIFYNDGSFAGRQSPVSPAALAPSCAPPPTFGCNSGRTLPDPAEVGAPFTFRFQLTTAGGNPGETYDYTATPTPGGGNPAALNPLGQVGGTIPQGSQPINVDIPGITATKPGIYNLNISVNITGASGTSCTFSFPVVSKPYFRVFSGDVIVGTNDCSVNNWGARPLTSSGQILAFSNGNGNGSGTQLAAQALAVIKEFSSAQGRTLSPVPDPGLSFANDSGPYGGTFGPGACPEDYWTNKDKGDTAPLNSGATSVNLNTTDSGATVYGGNLDVGPSGIQQVRKGKTIVLYVNGNATIKNNIKYQLGFRAGVEEIPSLTIIARGNIYIDANVTEVDAVLIAQPNGGSGGVIYTCSDNGATPSESFMANSCNQQLTITGAVIARTIKLLRTFGTVSDAKNAEKYNDTGLLSQSAERFIYSPEFWMRPNNVNRSPDIGGYDAITSLPPIL